MRPALCSRGRAPLRPFGARPSCEAGQFWHPHGKQKGRNNPGGLADSEIRTPIAPDFKSIAAAPGTVSDDTRVWQNVTPRSEQVSFCRIWADFRDAAFELARQNREKEQAFFAQKSSFVQCFMGDFYFLRQSGPEILPPGRKNPGPEKEIPGPENKIPSPEIFFPGPVFLRRRLGSTFSRYLELFHRQIPDVNMSAQAPPG